MQASASGPLGVLLMIAPLAAIPVLAIVGVPQFAPVSASPADEEEFSDLGDAIDSVSAPASEPPKRSRSAEDLDDLGALSTEPKADRELAGARVPLRAGPSRTSPPERSPTRELPPPEALDDWEVRPDSHDQTQSRNRSRPGPDPKGTSGGEESPSHSEDGLVSPEGFTADLLTPRQGGSRRSPSTSAAVKEPRGETGGSPANSPLDDPRSAQALEQLGGEQSGWQRAARRLKELGIRKYRLESQIEEQQFLFICSFASPDNPRVVRRFEATADNPLEAVEAVLAQIDEWRTRERSGEAAPLVLEEDADE